MERLERVSEIEIGAFLARCASGRATPDDEIVQALSWRMPCLLAELLALSPGQRARLLASLAAPRVAAPAIASAA